MLAWHFDLHDIDARLAEPIAEDQLDLDRARDGEDVHLKDLFHGEVEVGPAEWRLVRF